MTAPTGNSSTLGTSSKLWTRSGNVARIDINFVANVNTFTVSQDIAKFGLSFATSALLDNADNPYPTTFYFPATTQNIIVPAASQMVIPLILGKGATVSCVVSTTIGVTAQVSIFISDGPIIPASWTSSPAQQSGGTQTWSYLLFSVSGTWTVPANWNSANNVIEAYGGGGDGAGVNNSSAGGNGGAGGSYASISNYVATPGTNIAYQIGINNGSTGAGTVPTGNTWLKDNSTLIAAGSNGQIAAGTVNCVGTVKNSGGNGGTGAAATGGAGGGGSGGPNGAGLAGPNPVAGLPANGANGGNADISLGGGGGGGGVAGNLNGSSGGPGSETNGQYGAGGGGGGGAFISPGTSGNGGAGGAYGGGGGGAGGGSGSRPGGTGSPGALLISWKHG